MLFRRTNRPRRSLRPDQHFTLPARWKARPRLETLDERVVPAFLDPANYAVGTYPNAVVTGDFNNDAVQDLAFANWGDQTVSVLLGNADGTFDPAMSSPAGNAPTSLAAGDFNEDGWLDLVTGDPGYNNNFSDVTVLLGQGNGSFQAPVGLEVSADYYFGAESVSVGDFNGDGNLDIAAGTNVAWSSYYGGGVYGVAAVLLGTGTGAFSLSNWSYTGDGYNTAAAVADFNSDGNLDIASVTDYGYIFVSLGTGTGSFNYWDYYYNQGATPFAVAAADLNNDGTLDLVTANNYSDTASVLLGNGNGTFGSPQLFTAGSSPSSVATADFNGDGRMDAASANNSSHNVSVLLNDGNWPALSSPLLSINDVTVTEGNTGTVNAAFTVSLAAASSQAVTVHYATVDGSATTAGGDYQATSGTLTFAPGETTRTINVPVNGDRVVEFAEFFSLVLTNPSNSFVADARGTGTITDDEPRASIDYGPVYVTEGNTGTTNAEFTVRLSSAYDQPVDVNYATADAGATAGSDYQAVNATVTFAPGETVKTISVPIFGDRVAEYSEGFYVNLVGASGYAYGVIQDDEPRISINSVSVNEGNRGTTVMTFTVTLSAAYDQAVTVNFATHDYTAIAGQDYEATSGALTFAAGQTSMTISVLIKADKRKESTESFYVLLSDASENASISNAYGWGTIIDNDNGHGKGHGR